jgi:hypothetical protein
MKKKIFFTVLVVVVTSILVFTTISYFKFKETTEKTPKEFLESHNN